LLVRTRGRIHGVPFFLFLRYPEVAGIRCLVRRTVTPAPHMHPSPNTHWISHWWPALAWAVVAWLFSTSYFSGQQTSVFLMPLLQWLLPKASPATLDLIHLGIRKLGHVAEYFVLGWLVFRGVRGGRTGWKQSWALAALALAVGYALVDEGHQFFVANRGASFRDVLLDGFGALLAHALIWWRVARPTRAQSAAARAESGFPSRPHELTPGQTD